MTKARFVVLGGRVQGVGFRPFVYRLADALKLTGWVRNASGQVQIHIEGDPAILERFVDRLISKAPPLARPTLEESRDCAPKGATDFKIRPSDSADPPRVHVPPDMFTCDDCLAEMADPCHRRHQYPFINCTQCGPRYTIIASLPYDRPNTSMAPFALCPTCLEEYSDPLDRRFHAQPLACPNCGPTLTFRRPDGQVTGNAAALEATAGALSDGLIVAVMGVGGYHLMCDAGNDAAILRLRSRKHRPDKPLAVMFPAAGADGLETVRAHVRPDALEAQRIRAPERPIVLVRKKSGSDLSPLLAPGLDELGVFLPYAPLHHILLESSRRPLVATSGNISGEPVLTDRLAAETRLGSIADAFLHHDREILRPADDSVERVIRGAPRTLRVGRGLAPVELSLPKPLPVPLIATGGQMKNAIALAWENRVILSPHVGEMDSPKSVDVFAQVIADLQALYGVRAKCVVHDAHPGYAATRWARDCGLPRLAVQHHRAHASSVAGECGEAGPWLVFTWDAIGLGDDGSLWGGEAFLGGPGNWRRVASWRPFHLTGGDRPGREPWRSAAALYWEAKHLWSSERDDQNLAHQAWKARINSSKSSAVGRLFDAAACQLTGLTDTSYEGHGPMLLEGLAAGTKTTGPRLPLRTGKDGLLVSDWEPLLDLIDDDSLSGPARAAALHESFAQALVDQTSAIGKRHQVARVGLAGGVFQNRLLCDLVASKLEARDLPVHLGRRVPANDGGLAYGQVVEALNIDLDWMDQ